jgi:hypothetical protein
MHVRTISNVEQRPPRSPPAHRSATITKLDRRTIELADHTQPEYGSDSAPETCHSQVLRDKNFERAVKDGLWPVAGAPVGEIDATLLTFKIRI